MNTTTLTDIGDPVLGAQQYERLRANALGEINPAPQLTLFLRDGMSGWLRALQGPGHNHRITGWRSSSVFAGAHADMPGTELASILTDAILNTAGPVRRFGGNP